MASRGWRHADEWREKANRIAPTIVGGSKKHGGPDLGPTRARKAWAELGVDGLGIANEEPEENFKGMPRLTVRMVARIQGFPDDWGFWGGKTARYRQVGNAFPPPVAAAVANVDCIAKFLHRRSACCSGIIMGARDKLSAHFLANIGRVIERQGVAKVAGGITEWARRVQRTAKRGRLQILTHNDRSDLKPASICLSTPSLSLPFSRNISKEMRAQVLDRNGFTCQMCGAVAGEPHPYDHGRKTRLHIGHIVDKSLGGTDELSNLRAICSVCNEGAANITADRPTALNCSRKFDVQPRSSSWKSQVAGFKI